MVWLCQVKYALAVIYVFLLILISSTYEYVSLWGLIFWFSHTHIIAVVLALQIMFFWTSYACQLSQWEIGEES